MATTADWLKYHATSRRSASIAEVWVRDVVSHLRADPTLGADTAILDFGCGYFDLGAAMAPHVGRMDGLEIDPYSLNLARSRVAELHATRIFERNDDVPNGAYDLVIANSVFQYLQNEGEALCNLQDFRRWLRPGPRSRVALIDLIPPRYSPPRDALRSMWVATLNGIPITMAQFLWNAATSPHGRSWLRLDPSRIQELAAEAGFTCQRLDRNLSPSLQRYTVVLRPTR